MSRHTSVIGRTVFVGITKIVSLQNTTTIKFILHQYVNLFLVTNLSYLNPIYQGLQSLYSISYAIVLLETCFCVDVFGYNSSFTSLIPHRISFCRNDMLGDFAFLHQSTHVG